MSVSTDGIWDMCSEIEARMVQSREDESTAILDLADCIHEDWHADDLAIKGPTVGCRLAGLNGAKKLFMSHGHRGEVKQLMLTWDVDVLVLSEPGYMDAMAIAALKSYMIASNMAAEVVARGPYTGAGGQVMLINRKWAKLQRTVHRFAPLLADKDRVLAVEFNNRISGDHNKLLVLGYYGYNDAQGHREEIKEMHTFIWTVMKRFRKANPFGSVALLGDINAAKWTDLDTDARHLSGEAVGDLSQHEDQREREPDAFVINHLESFGLVDTVRERYPENNFVTRKASHHTNRLLDRIFVTKDMTGDTMRAGIFQQAIFTQGGKDTDHKLMVTDLPIDCAGGAARQVKLWSKHKKETLRWDADDVGEIASEKIEQFNEIAAATAPPPPGQGAEAIHSWLLSSATGTVLKRTLQEFPKKARNMHNFQSNDWSVRESLKRMRESVRKLELANEARNRQMKRAKRPLKRIGKNTHGPELRHIHKWCLGKSKEHILDLLQGKIAESVEWLAKTARDDRQDQIRKSKKKRTMRFNHVLKKKLKCVITSIMRRAAVHEEITTCDRQPGEGTATSVEEVAREVVKFYEQWMTSKVDWRQRWRSWEDMVSMNTDGLIREGDKEFVEMAYRESHDKFCDLQNREGIWDAVWASITLETTRSTLARLKSGTAGGPSEITYDVLKALDDDNLEVIREQLQGFLDGRALPRVLNRSLLRPLPKTDAGLANLALTRPIALIEVLGKLFEKILFDRILAVLVEYEMLDESQYGGMPLRSTAPPMHNLAEAMQDAQVSGQELHVASKDLSKAFDSLEHWSQAMSWTALGMPQEMTEMLMHMDQEGETAVILGQGRNTADVLGEDGWFKSGRGVRQGSIGGPIKWIVYMNFWLKYMHKKHEGQGYKMSRAERGDQELLGQMFIDDSNWFASSVANLTAMIASNEIFVEFHGLSFNIKKCEYIAINQSDCDMEWARPTWSSGAPLVEKIRVVKDKGQWAEKRDRVNEELKVCREQLHVREEQYKDSPDSEWDWLHELDRIHDAMDLAEQTSRERWWAQATEQTKAEMDNIQGILTRTQTLLLTMYEGAESEILEGAAAKIRRWELAVENTNKAAILPGRAMRYLGMWYEAGFKWKAQRKILSTKFSDLNDRIMHSAPTREEAVYCINATINSALKYPLRVAWVNKTTLKAWDTANRKVVSKAGSLPAMSPLVYHLPKDQGGLGLESLEWASDRGQVEAYMEALNHQDLNGSITRAGRRRFCANQERGLPEKGTIHEVVHAILGKHGWSITGHMHATTRLMTNTYTVSYAEQGVQGVLDKGRAAKNAPMGGKWEIYGDGATYESENRAGWGVWARRIDPTGGTSSTRANGRMPGKQSNDGAEAMAILRGLLMVSPQDKATFYCDNQGCVRKWAKLGTESTMRWGFRAVWNRIGALKDEREKLGNPMRMAWVHSHVDDEARRVMPTKKMACACRENGEQECNEYHRHHAGNDEADKEAKGGAAKVTPYSLREVAKGDTCFVLHNTTSVSEGAYGSWMREQITERAIMDAAGGGADPEAPGKRLRSWARGILETDRKIRTAVVKSTSSKGATSWRFWARASLEMLPTMSQMSKFGEHLQHENAYHQVYGAHIGEDGGCSSCDHQKETTSHALWECPESTHAWEAMDLAIWHEWDLQGLDWDAHDWKRSMNSSPGWNMMWGLLGMVPPEAVSKLAASIGHIAAFTMIKKAAVKHLDTAATVWALRNERHLEWEKTIPELMEAKAKAKHTVWSRKSTQSMKQNTNRTRYGPDTLAKTKKKQANAMVAAARERAGLEVRDREIRRNETRRRDHRPLVSAMRMLKMIEAAAADAARRVRRTLLETSRDLILRGQHVPLDQMACNWTEIAKARPIALLHAQSQRGQEGWWIPKHDTQVTAFWESCEGKDSLGGTKGDWNPGKVTAVGWDEGEYPTCQIEYPCGHREWHCTSTAGTAVKVRTLQKATSMGLNQQTDKMPVNAALLLGPGAELSVRWETAKGQYSWFSGVVVTNMDTEIAVRYEGSEHTPTMIQWHTDLHCRGCRIQKLVRTSEGANERFQLQHQRKHNECALLTDKGECECAWCFTVGWPAEIDILEEQGISADEVWSLRNLDPREGRKVAARKLKKHVLQLTKQEALKRKLPPEALPANRNGQVEDCVGGTSERALRYHKRCVPSEPVPPGSSDQDQEVPDRDRPTESREAQGLAGARSRPRLSGPDRPTGSEPELDGATGEEVSQTPPGHHLGKRSLGEREPDPLPGEAGSPGGDPDMGGRKRRAPERGQPIRPPEREEGPTEDCEMQGMEETWGGLAERNNSDAGRGRAGLPRNRPGRPVDQAISEVDQNQGMDLCARGPAGSERDQQADNDASPEQAQGWEPVLGHDPRHGRGMGLNRESERGDPVRIDWSRLGGLVVPGHAARPDQIQSTHELCKPGHRKPAGKDSEESRDCAGQHPDGVALAGMHPPVQSECYEQDPRMCTRTICGDTREHSECDPRETRGGEGQIPTVQDSGGTTDASARGGGHAVRPGEPSGEPLLGAGVGDIQDCEEPHVETPQSGPVRIWEEGEENNHDPDKHTVGPPGTNGEWQVHDRDLWGHSGKHPRSPRGSTTCPADSRKRAAKEDTNGAHCEGSKRGVLVRGSKEQGRKSTGTGADPGSEGAPGIWGKLVTAPKPKGGNPEAHEQSQDNKNRKKQEQTGRDQSKRRKLSRNDRHEHTRSHKRTRDETDQQEGNTRSLEESAEEHGKARPRNTYATTEEGID
jgi:ribonuclease HI